MRYNPSKIEAKWQKRWLKEKIYEPDLKRAKKPFYNLMMFPYPSGEGLHVGHAYTFSGADVYGRFKRMQGQDVFQPIGYDSFGIHSENYAIKIGEHPKNLIKKTTKRYEGQLKSLGIGYAWKEALATSDPEYYRWTQWIFTAMFKNGLAYRKKSPVNWCPGCKTVLADEQVIAGKCERCSSVVVKKELEQWFFKITDYAEKLLQNLETIDWSEKIKIAQKNWIGRSEGAEIEFKVIVSRHPESATSGRRISKDSSAEFTLNVANVLQNDIIIKVFTTRPDTLFGATYMVLAPEHPLIKNFQFSIFNFQEVKDYIEKTKNKSEADRIVEGKEKTGVELKGIKAINPANQEEIPIFIADYVLGNVGTGAIMAVPGHDERDFEFAKKFGVRVIKVIDGGEMPYTGKGKLINSGKFSGMDSEEAKWEITKFIGGERKTQYRLRDWLISRQRYWGPPIPMIFCEKCQWQSVPEKDLPVKLPYLKNFRPTGTDKSPLAADEKFYKVRCPKCHAWARRETDVSDTFLDSAWYYIAYLMKFENWKLKIGNSEFAKQTRRWLPVDMYIGGAEHAVLHLLYVRFLAMAMHDWKLLHFEEPFKKFRAHGLLIKDGAKMSKSKGNVVNPDEYLRAYGADALRMYLLFLGPFEQGGDFRDTGIRGLTRFLERVFKLGQEDFSKNPANAEEVDRLTHTTIKKVTEDIEGLQYNTAISALMVLLNKFAITPQKISQANFSALLRILAPLAPHLTEELWQKQQQPGKFKSIHQSPWPAYDPELLKKDDFELVIQINGKVRGRVKLRTGAGETEAKKIALNLPEIKKLLTKDPLKVIFVPNRLINFVTGLSQD